MSENKEDTLASFQVIPSIVQQPKLFQFRCAHCDACAFFFLGVWVTLADSSNIVVIYKMYALCSSAEHHGH